MMQKMENNAVQSAAPQMMTEHPTLGSLMRGLRTRNRWTLKEMSAHSGIPVSTLSKVEHDRLTLTYDKAAVAEPAAWVADVRAVRRTNGNSDQPVKPGVVLVISIALSGSKRLTTTIIIFAPSFAGNG